MVKKYICEKCGKSFSQKGHFTNHLNRKTPCKPVENKVIEEKIKDKLQELSENGEIEIKNINLISNNKNNNIVDNMEKINKKEIKTPEMKSLKDKDIKIEESKKEIKTPEMKSLKDKNIFLNENNIYINDNNITFKGNCLEKMKLIKNDSIDLILCDLPYGTTRCKWDCIIDIDKLWIEYKRIIKKPQGVICLFGDQPFTSKLISTNYEWFKYDITWYKNKTTQYLLANYRPMKCKEDIILFSPGGAAAASRKKGNMTYNPQGLIPKLVKKVNSQKRIGKMLNQEHHLGKNNKLISNKPYEQKFTNYPKNIINFDIESDTKHETQKPVKLIEYLINTYSNENDIVLDNTMGSGTTGIGCINTNRQFIGMELNYDYYHMAFDRITKHLEDHLQSVDEAD